MTPQQILVLAVVAAFIVALAWRLSPTVEEAEPSDRLIQPASRAERRLWRRVARLSPPAQQRLLAFLNHELASEPEDGDDT